MRADLFVIIVAFVCAGVTAADAGEKPVVLKPQQRTVQRIKCEMGVASTIDLIDAIEWEEMAHKL